MIELHLSELLAAAAIFLFTLLCLDRILFHPFIRVIRERESLTSGRLEEADELLRRCQQLTREYQERIRQEKFQGYRLQEEQRSEALARRAELIAETRQRAEQMVAEARADVAHRVDRVQESLESEARLLAAAIGRRVLGREIQ